MASYLPSKEADLDVWTSNFATKIFANPSWYNVSAADALTIQTSVGEFHTAYLAATDPTACSRVAVAAKNSFKAAMLDTIRYFAGIILRSRAISNDLKEDLGLSIVDTSPTPIAEPVTHPLLKINDYAPLKLTLGFNDSASPDSKAKPEGVSACVIFTHFGSTPPTNTDDWTWRGMATRQNFPAVFGAGQSGSLVWIIGRWTTSTGKLGPFGPAIASYVVGTGPVAPP